MMDENQQRPASPGNMSEDSLEKAFAARPRGLRIEGLDIGEALDVLRRGGRVARADWNGRGQYVAMVINGFASGRHMPPFLTIVTPTGDIVPWVASQSDLISADWMVVREESILVYGHNRGTLVSAHPDGDTKRARSTTGDHG